MNKYFPSRHSPVPVAQIFALHLPNQIQKMVHLVHSFSRTKPFILPILDSARLLETSAKGEAKKLP